MNKIKTKKCIKFSIKDIKFPSNFGKKLIKHVEEELQKDINKFNYENKLRSHCE